MKAMIFAAGLGTRLKPWTDFHPKALAIVNGKSLLQRNIEYLQLHGIYDVIVNVHHFAEQIITAIESSSGWGSKIEISDESDEVLETGGGLLKAGWYFSGEESFVVMNADVLTDMNLSDMIRFHKEQGGIATLATSDRTTSRYFLFNNLQVLCGWENVQTGARKMARMETTTIRKAFSGIHLISTGLFDLVKQTGKFSMVDVYLALAAGQDIYSYDHSGSRFLDVGKPESINEAGILFPE
ncbi:NDP-sugar pyrophosphorylase family protein [Filimonas zeae]|uniref:Mannose-1-phosphate guanylyltransferase n=1 Tax=Filimonas zeae TaxID=1737353 RepID=A0A917J4K6_9BACT|nr:sugar phosphate nucleotidyltransferase [Filimonas zeae]MDR6341809.1 NDP-sugar pyrophosphorylase family protein [Filimonas zeae]GGH80243.1 mannose-1-phosphate guanylyltransferase [Filimonas zeae]